MTDEFSAGKVGALVRRNGLPARPTVDVQSSEVRSDTMMLRLPSPDAPELTPAIAPLIIEWRFRLGYEMIPEFHGFLFDNERFIKDSCQTVMTGVSYHGTYYGANGQRATYRTYWGYASWQAHYEWAKVVAEGDSRFYQVVRALRGYWLRDPNGAQEFFVAAAGIKPSEHPFLALTIDAARQANP